MNQAARRAVLIVSLLPSFALGTVPCCDTWCLWGLKHGAGPLRCSLAATEPTVPYHLRAWSYFVTYWIVA